MYSKSFPKYRFRQNTAKNVKEISFDYKSLLPFLGPVLILLGATRLIFFYMFFSIDIINYLEFGEILTSFFDAVVLGTFIVVIFLSAIVPQLIEHESQNPSLFASLTKSQRGKAGVTIVSIFLLLGILNAFLTERGLETINYRIYSMMLLMSLGFILAGYILFRPNKIKLERKVFVLFLALVNCSLIFLLYSNYQEYSRIRFGKKNKDIKVVLDSKTLPTSSLYYYVGNTKNYLFVYDEKNKVTEVYPMSRVKEIYYTYDFLKLKDSGNKTMPRVKPVPAQQTQIEATKLLNSVYIKAVSPS